MVTNTIVTAIISCMVGMACIRIIEGSIKRRYFAVLHLGGSEAHKML